MSAVWISSPTLIIITLGFAGLLGNLIRRLRQALQPKLAALTALLALLVLFPPLSLPGLLNWLLWLASLGVVLLFAVRPDSLPPSLHTRRFALRYASAAMLLSAWGNALYGPSFPACMIAAFALLAALLAWLESNERESMAQ